MKEKFLSTSIGAAAGIMASIGEEAAKVFVLGVIGGAGGLVGRELFKFLKVKTVELWQKRK